MAIRAVVAGAYDDGRILAGYDWNDANGEVTLLRCTQGSALFAITLSAVGTGGGKAGRRRNWTVQPGAGLVTIAIPSSQRPTFPVVLDEEGDPTLSDLLSVRVSLTRV